jgi:hypothetical protein
MSSSMTIVQPDVCLFLFVLGLQFSMPYGMPKKQEENRMWINFLRSLYDLMIPHYRCVFFKDVCLCFGSRVAIFFLCS